MNAVEAEIGGLVAREYKEGFVTEIDSDTLPPGLDERVIRTISGKKNEPDFMLEWRLEAYRQWRQDANARMGACALPTHRFSGH